MNQLDVELIREAAKGDNGYLGNELRSLAARLEAQSKAEPYKLLFPTMLRKMWSGGEVQEWLNELPPLFTHADAGEVEILKEQNKTATKLLDEQLMKVLNLESQLFAIKQAVEEGDPQKIYEAAFGNYEKRSTKDDYEHFLAYMCMQVSHSTAVALAYWHGARADHDECMEYLNTINPAPAQEEKK